MSRVPIQPKPVGNCQVAHLDSSPRSGSRMFAVNLIKTRGGSWTAYAFDYAGRTLDGGVFIRPDWLEIIDLRNPTSWSRGVWFIVAAESECTALCDDRIEAWVGAQD